MTRFILCDCQVVLDSLFWFDHKMKQSKIGFGMLTSVCCYGNILMYL